MMGSNNEKDNLWIKDNFDFKKNIIDQMLDAFSLHKVIIDDKGEPIDYEYIYVNPSFEKFTGIKKGNVIGKRVTEIIPGIENDSANWIKTFGNVAITGEPTVLEESSEALGRWYSINCYSPEPGYFITIFHDISNLKKSEIDLYEKNCELTSIYEELLASEEELRVQLEEITKRESDLQISEERYRLSLEGSNDILWDVDMINKTAHCSNRWYELTGIELSKKNNLYDLWGQVVIEEDILLLREAISDHLKGLTLFFSCEFRLETKEGIKWFYARGKALKDIDGELKRIAGSLTDINHIKENELKLQETQRKLKNVAYYDYLTGIPNRFFLYEFFPKYIEKPNQGKALIYIDVDDFKYINDVMGHLFGDELIKQIGNRLSKLIGEEDGIFRFGGDEFIICLGETSNLEEIEKVAYYLSNSFSKPFRINNQVIHITVTLGIALYPQHGKTLDEVMKYADIALYNAKTMGKNKIIVFDKKMNEAVTQRMLFEGKLRTALENNEFSLHYQPVVNIESNTICEFEALLRWNNKDLGNIPPNKFIKVAEDTHMIIPIGDWVLNEACSFISKLHMEGHEGIGISVNISIIQIMQEDFNQKVMKVLKKTGLNPSMLQLEITESVLIESYVAIRKKLEFLRLQGIKIALDDFGQGYSSLSYLRNLPITTLKIDKAFTDEILINSKDSLIGSIVLIGRKMGLNVVAEGVELEEQVKYLRKYECHKIQGYYYSKPLPGDKVQELL